MDKLIVVASTHWDREWYRTAQDFQIRLCDLMDQLLDLLERDDNFGCYTFDGQSVVLDDYLEIHPENETRIRSLVSRGKLVFGPLYNLPDEFLSGGEALIRNFLIGEGVCSKIGGKMQAGYLPDNFGHISQLPQILNGVGLDSAFFFRGTNIETLTSKEFYWDSPDGSRVLGEYMPLGYWSLKSWGRLGMSVSEHFYSAYEKLIANSKLKTVLLINGSDHLYQDPEFTSKLKTVKEAFPDLEITNGSISDYADIARTAAVSGSDLPVIRGELRDFRFGPDPTAVTSTRSYLKRLLNQTLSEVEKYAEPLASINASTEKRVDYPRGFFTKTWKLILKSLGHDGVSGCSTDEVMKDVETYLVHAYQIAERISETHLQQLSERFASSRLNEHEQALVLFNPHPFECSGITRQVIQIEKGNIAYKDFGLYDRAGNKIPYEVVGITENVMTREFNYDSKEKIFRTAYEVIFKVDKLPAFGLKPYIVKKSALIDKREAERFIRFQNSDETIVNQFFEITVNGDGSIDVFDKRNNSWHKGLNKYVGRGEVGDEYQHVSPLFDKHTFTRLTNLSMIKNSPLSQKLIITASMMIPQKMDKRMMGRTESTKECLIRTEVTLYDATERIDFKVEIDNQSEDHIIFSKFPANFKNCRDFSYISFDEVGRDNQIFEYDPELNSTQALLKPMQKYAGVKGDDGSIHVAAKGIYEYHTKKRDDGLDFYLTLLRSTSYLFHGLPLSWKDGQHSTTPLVETNDSKELGISTLEYSLYLNENEVTNLAEAYLYPMRGINQYHNAPYADNEEFSFFDISNKDVSVSAVKMSEDGKGVILRLFNLKTKSLKTDIRTYLPIKDCSICDMLEQPTMKADFDETEIRLVIEAKKIMTIIIEWR